MGPDEDVDLPVVHGDDGVVALGFGDVGHPIDEAHGLDEVAEDEPPA